jgi:hypothetical protein
MNHLLARIRRLRNRGARYVAAAFGVAYLSAALAPCVAAAGTDSSPAGTEILEHSMHVHVPPVGHEGQHGHEAPRVDAVPHHGHDLHGDMQAAHAVEETGPQSSHCPHCPDGLPSGAAMMHDSVHATCSLADALTDLAAVKANDAPEAYVAPIVLPAAFVLPPPLASPLAPPARSAARAPSVALNVRHCVFLI